MQDRLDFLQLDRPQRIRFHAGSVEHGSRTHHSNMDLYDRVQVGDVMQGAALEAWFVYNTAIRPEMLPRNPVPTPTAK
jgi:carboxypeptidase Q